MVDTLLDDDRINDGLSVDDEGWIFASHNGSGGQLTGDTIYRIAADGGSIEPFVSGLPPWPLASDFGPDGDLYVSLWGAGEVGRVSEAGVHRSFTTGISGPAGLDVAPDGTVFVAGYGANAVWRVDTDGTRTVHATGAPIRNPSGLAHDDSTGNVYVSNWTNGRITEIEPDGTTAMLAELPTPGGTGAASVVVVGGRLFASGYAAHQIFQVDLASGEVSVLAGSGDRGTTDGPADEATFDSPTGLAVSADGSVIYVSQDAFAAASGGGPGGLRTITGHNPS